jgi:predicted dehydrogenase
VESPEQKKSTHFYLKIASAGGFGHFVDVLDDLQQANDPSIRFCGICPAYAGESISVLKNHPWTQSTKAREYSSLEDLLSAEAPDVLIVSTRPDQIAQSIRKGIDGGCHIISEKPLALQITELDKLENHVRQHSKRVEAMLSMRRLPAFREAKYLIEQGCIGDVLLLNTRKSYKWGSRPAWFNNRALYGGTWPWVGIHNLDMAHFLAGRHAVSCQATHHNAAHPDFPHCEDICCGIFLLEGGIPMTASVDYLRHENSNTHGDDWCRVVGSRGTVEVFASEHRLVLNTEGQSSELVFDQAACPTYLEIIEQMRQPSLCFDNTAFQLTRSVLMARDVADRATQQYDPLK